MIFKAIVLVFHKGDFASMKNFSAVSGLAVVLGLFAALLVAALAAALMGCGGDGVGDTGGTGYEVVVEGEIVYLVNEETAKMYVLAAADEQGINFGASVAMHEAYGGILAAVGAPGAGDGLGAVYVFFLTRVGVEPKAKLTPPYNNILGYGERVRFRKMQEGWVLFIESSFGNSAKIEISHLM